MDFSPGWLFLNFCFPVNLENLQEKYGTIKIMNNIVREFISQESRKFKFQLGHHLASSLSGFVAGVVAASIVWITSIWIWRAFFLF